MKNIKKVLCLVLALVMVAALGVSAWASTAEYTLSVSKTALDAGHTYVAYQIFDADPITDENDRIPDATESSTFVETFVEETIEWGYSLDTVDKQKAFIAALNDKLGTTIPNDATAADVATALSAMTNTANLADIIAEAAEAVPVAGTDDSTRTIDSAHPSLKLPTGYYFIKETGGLETKNIVYRHVADETIDSKLTKDPKFDKQVETSNGSNSWADSADYSASKNAFGTETETEIEATKTNVNFRIVATLPETFGADGKTGVTMNILDRQNDHFTLDRDSVEVYYVPAGVDLEDANHTGWKELTAGATTESGDYQLEAPYRAGTTNYTFAVKFTSMETHTDPKFEANGRIVVLYTSELTGNAELSQKNEATLEFDGDTLHDDVTVYTFELDIDKIDGDSTNKDPLQGAEFTLYEWIGTEEPTAETNKNDENWKKVWTYNVPEGQAGESSFKIEGLKQGKYKLVEDKTKEGYNVLAEPIYLDVVAEYNKDQLGSLKVVECNSDWTTKKENTPNGGETGVHVEVVNNKGVVLPETGGIGTTIFYIGGAVLLLGAVVLLVTRRRAKFDED